MEPDAPRGAGGGVLIGLLGLCVVMLAALGWRYAAVRRAWTRDGASAGRWRC